MTLLLRVLIIISCWVY